MPRNRLACFLLGIATPLVPGLLFVGIFYTNPTERQAGTEVSQTDIWESEESVLNAPIINKTIRTLIDGEYEYDPSLSPLNSVDFWDEDFKQRLLDIEAGKCALCVSEEGLIWPIYGPISSPYGPGHPLGIDIDLQFAEEFAVKAATDSTVVFAGGNKCCAYGLYIVLVSSDGIETLYAHLRALEVIQGETVEQGQKIAIAGSTGYSTGRHLHFEVIDNGVRVDPIKYLPRIP